MIIRPQDNIKQPSNIRSISRSWLRYQELEEALGLAEQHLNDSDKQTVIQDLQQQVNELQAEVHSRANTAEHLRQELEKAEAARQQAAAELSVALRQQHSVKVGHSTLQLC